MNNRKIDEKEVKHVAKLSRLSLSDKDVARFSGELNLILEYISKLNNIDTKSVNPTSHVVENVKNVFREDKIKKSLSQEEALKNAPKKVDNFFGVPKVIE